MNKPFRMVVSPLPAGHGVVIYTGADAVAQVAARVKEVSCGHVRARTARTVRDIRVAYRQDADVIGFVGDLNDATFEALADVAATGYIVLLAAPGLSYITVAGMLCVSGAGAAITDVAQGPYT